MYETQIHLPIYMWIYFGYAINFRFKHHFFFTRGKFWPSGIVVAKLGSPNLDQRCKTPWLRSLLFWCAINLDLEGQIWLKNPNLPHFELVRRITHHPLKLESPNLDQKYKICWLRSLLFWGQLTVIFNVKFDLKSQIVWFHHYRNWKYMTTREPWVPRLLHGPDCFMASILYKN